MLCSQGLWLRPEISTGCVDVAGVVLVGDSAHSMWASLGQGCNTALETCQVFADTLAKHKTEPLAMALEEYTATRKPDTEEIGRLSQQGLGGSKQRAASPSFIAYVVLIRFPVPVCFCSN